MQFLRYASDYTFICLKQLFEILLEVSNRDLNFFSLNMWDSFKSLMAYYFSSKSFSS